MNLFSLSQFNMAQFGDWFVRISPDALALLKTLSFWISVGLGAILIIIILKFRALYQPEPSLIEELNIPQPAGGAYRARWEEILRHMDSAKEAEWKFAVIEADKLIDLVLQKAGFPGETLGERLMNIQDGQIANLQGLWDAHKIRNRLAHDVDHFLRYTEAKQAIDQYESVLRELGGI